MVLHHQSPLAGDWMQDLPKREVLWYTACMRMNVYVDGLNLYYGALKGGPHKWLDISAFCRSLLNSADTINQIHYFTAVVSSLPDDPDAKKRQLRYLRALRTLPEVEIHYGRFLSSDRNMMRADGDGIVTVVYRQEKGSDVNLASQMLIDAHDNDFEGALVVSNDSDLLRPIELVRTRFKRPVGVAFPVLNDNDDGLPRKPRQPLVELATFRREIEDTLQSKRQLAESQLDNPLTDDKGTFFKPDTW